MSTTAKDDIYDINHNDQADNTDSAEKGRGLDYVETDTDVIAVTQKSPYFERNFIGTYAAVCLGALSCYGGFVLPATSLALINEDIGPSANITWVSLVWTLSTSVGFTLVGRLSDIFGRRWFFIGCSLLATIGCVVGSTAKDVNQLIGANVLIGLAAASQLSFSYTIGELVPIKHRGFILSFAFTSAAPFSAFGSYISRLFIVHTSAGWRWDYYVTIIINALSTILYFIFYHPPHFGELHRSRSRMQELKDLDYGGIVLFIAGLLLFLMGLSWGGSLYAWDSAHVIASLIIGFVLCVAFVLYECYMPLRRPLIPMHLFRNRDYSVLVIITSVGGMLYYSQNVIYPTMVSTLLTTDIVEGGLLSCAIGGGVALGQFLGAFFATYGGFIRWKLFFTCICMTAFTGALAGVILDRPAASALATLSAIMIGAMESLAITLVTIVIANQSELGTGAGVFGSLRSMCGVVATTIFSAILTNKVTGYTQTIIIPDIVKAGLPLSSVEAFLTALNSGDSGAFAAVPGATESVINAGLARLKTSYSKAFTVVYLVSIACGGLSVIAAWFAPNLEDKIQSHDVVRRLAGSEEKRDKGNDIVESKVGL